MKGIGMSYQTAFELWLEFEHWTPEPDDDPEDEFFNMKVTLASGKQYAMNVWTFKRLERVVSAVRSQKPEPEELVRLGHLHVTHPLEREYLTTPDLLVSRLDRKLIDQIVAHMLHDWGGQLLPQWECEPPLTQEELND